MKALTVPLATPVRLLVLIGGGEFSFGETREIDEFLLSEMAPEKRTIAFLPTASGSAEYAKHVGDYFAKIDPTVATVNVPIYRGRDGRRGRNLDQILSAGMVYLGGGVTNNLLETLRQSPAEMAMREAGANGAVIAAIGAAGSCFGVRTRDMRGSVAALDALGWLENTVVEAGFDSGDDMLRRLMSVPGTELGLGIPAGTALAISADGSTRVIGNGNIAAFRKA